MNLWDSVHRGLEKASQEAARIAKAQRLRAAIDGMTRQIEVQQGTLVAKVMDMFMAGQLTQPELLVLCQEISSLRQQVQQAQNELRAIQGSVPSSAPGGYQAQSTQVLPTTPTPPYGTSIEPPSSPAPMSSYAPPPPDYPPYGNTRSTLQPPPPPGIEEGMNSGNTVNTVAMNDVAVSPAVITPFCSVCHATLTPGNTFCSHCGAPVASDSSTTATRMATAEHRSSVDEKGEANSSPAINTPQVERQDGGH